MLDKIFAAIGMLGVIAFMGIVAVFVMEPDLWVVAIIVISIGIIFFVRELREGDSQVEGDNQADSEN